MKKLLLVLFITAMGMFEGHSQALVQTYVDRCTGEVTVFTVPMNGKTVVTFYNRSKTISAQDIYNGSFQAWLEETYAWWNALNPCSTAATGATATTNTTQQTTEAATNAANNAATNAANTSTNAPSTNTNPPPPTDTSQSTSQNTGNTSTNSDQTNTASTGENTTGKGDSSSTSGGSDSSTSGSSEDTSTSESSSSGSTDSENQTSESSQSDETSEVENTSEESTEEQSTEEEATEEQTSEEESTEEDTKEEQEEEEQEEESSEEEKEEESDEEEKEEDSEEAEEEDSKEDSKKKKKKKRKLAPPIVSANVLSQQNPTGGYTTAASFGISQSSLLGDKTYGATFMAWSNGQQFMLNTNYSKVHINKKGRVSRVYSASVGLLKVYTTWVAMMNHSWTFLGKKGSVAGIAFGTSLTNLEVDIRNGMLLLDQQFLGGSITGFYSKPIQYSDKLSFTPMVAISAPFLSFDTYEKITTFNTDAVIIGGTNLNYKLTKRFGLNIGATAVTSTAPEFPVLMNYTIGGRLSF